MKSKRYLKTNSNICSGTSPKRYPQTYRITQAIGVHEIARFRKAWRKRLGDDGAYQPWEYSFLATAHASTLSKLLKEFHKYLAVWVSQDSRNRDAAAEAFYGNFESILAGGQPRVSQVLRLFRSMDLRKEFIEYLVGKTQLSLEIEPNQPEPETDRGPSNNGIYYAKLAEFVVCILAEYTMLHNYCFVGKVRPKGISSIDPWMKEIS